MNIATVVANLRRTISNKENYLSSIYMDSAPGSHVIAKMLEVNINELKLILADVEACS
jgi:hypothetical protein